MNTFDYIHQRRAQMQANILKGFNPELGNAITEHSELEKAETEYNMLLQKGEIEFDDELEKATYADTPQNRKLGRVGQEYKRGKGGDGNSNKKPQPKLSHEEHTKNITKIFDDYEEHGDDEKLKKHINAYTRKHNMSHHEFNNIMDSDHKNLNNYAVRQSRRHNVITGENAWDFSDTDYSDKDVRRTVEERERNGYR